MTIREEFREYLITGKLNESNARGSTDGIITFHDIKSFDAFIAEFSPKAKAIHQENKWDANYEIKKVYLNTKETNDLAIDIIQKLKLKVKFERF